jgi:hypothetical protein
MTWLGELCCLVELQRMGTDVASFEDFVSHARLRVRKIQPSFFFFE